MSTLTFPHHAGDFGQAVLGKVAKTLKAFAAYVRHEREVRTCISELCALNDRELADMGIGRNEIEAVVRGRRR